MKKLLPFIAIFFLATTAWSQRIPHIKVDKEHLGVKKLAIDVQVVGNISTTTFDMQFYNPTYEVLEGELVFPLGENQSVKRFALDVMGKLREAVVVEKEQGRIAFEAVVRRRVDPALLEKGTGNNYKARIYPIPAKGYKRVILAYQENLSAGQDAFDVKVPLHFKNSLEAYSISVRVFNQDEVPKIISGKSKGARFVKQDNDYVYTVSQKNVTPTLDFLMQIPIVSDIKAITNEGYLYAYKALESKKIEKKKPECLTLLWDVSLSMKDRDLKKEIAYLDAYFKRVKNIEIEAIAFSNVIVSNRTFSLQNGNWEGLQQFLESQVYDGATSFKGLFENTNTNAEIVVFTDGLPTYSKVLDNKKNPVYIINSNQKANHNQNKVISTSSGAAYINLKNTSVADAIEKTFTQPLLFLGYEHTEKDISLFPKKNTPIYKDVSITVKGVTAGQKITLLFGYGGTITKRLSLEVSEKETPYKNLGAIWAQANIDYLQQNSEANRDEIVQVAQQYNLVSNHTSLIVLETARDYLRYNITPPEELLKEYLQLKKDKENEHKVLAFVEDQKVEERTNNEAETLKEEAAAPAIASGAEVTVFGTVLDDSGLPLPGVNVLVKGTSTGTQTDFDGNYSIAILTGQDLVFSYVGFDALETTVQGSGRVNMTMSAGETLNEVVITGYGIPREKKAIGYSITTIEAEEFENKPEADIVRSLNGKVAGVQIVGSSGATGSGTNFVIRGNSSINGDNAPLFVVDGVPFNTATNQQTGFTGGSVVTSSRFLDLDPNNVESVKILKGLSASVLYGQQGRNGVVIITTKTGSGIPGKTGNYAIDRAAEIAKQQEERIALAGEPTWNEKEWTTPYLSKLKEVTPEDLYTFYLSQRASFIGHPAYFVDVYDFMRDKNRILANRILSNIAEMDQDNYELLKVLAYKLEEKGDFEQAVFVYRQVLKLRSEDTQSYRDLALALAEIGAVQEALDLLTQIANKSLIKGTDRRDFEGMIEITTNEIRNLIHTNTMKISNDKLPLGVLQKKELDVRVVIDWNHNDTDIDLHVIDPNLEKCFYGASVTSTGGKISDDMTEGFGPEEYTQENATKGSYYVKVDYFDDRYQKVENPTFMKITTFRNYGSKNQTKKVKVIRLSETDDLQMIDRIAVL